MKEKIEIKEPLVAAHFAWGDGMYQKVDSIFKRLNTMIRWFDEREGTDEIREISNLLVSIRNEIGYDRFDGIEKVSLPTKKCVTILNKIWEGRESFGKKPVTDEDWSYHGWLVVLRVSVEELEKTRKNMF